MMQLNDYGSQVDFGNSLLLRFNQKPEWQIKKFKQMFQFVKCNT